MGTAQVPVVYDRCARRWLHDTTSIIELLETEAEANAETAAKQIDSASVLLDTIGMAETGAAAGSSSPQNIPHATASCGISSPLSVLPACPLQRFFSFLVEDFADEALWRPAMYFRWAPALDRAALSRRFTFEFARRMPLPQWAAQRVMAFRQWLFSVFGEGIESDAQHAAAQTQYVAALDSMQRILEGGDGGTGQRKMWRRKFMLGDAPTLADFGMMVRCSECPFQW
jgi:hypothetical protein